MMFMEINLPAQSYKKAPRAAGMVRFYKKGPPAWGHLTKRKKKIKVIMK